MAIPGTSNSPFLSLEQHPQHAIAAIDENGHQLSYGDLQQQASALAQHIDSRALVFIYCENSFGALIGYLACLSHQAVPLLLDKQLENTLSDRLLNTYRPGWVWRPQRAEGPDRAAVFTRYNYELVPTGLAPFPLHRDLALLVSTSGSTGSPRLVRLSQQNIQANAESIAHYLAIDRHERAVVNLPMNYVYGLSIINSHLLRGATLLFTTKTVTQRAFWQFIASQAASSLAGVPYTYEMLQRIGFLSMPLPALKTLTQAGGKLPAKLHHAFAHYARQHNKAFIVMYGAAEATARMAWLPADRSLEKCGSIGKAIPGGQLMLVDEQGREISGANQAGELRYVGPNVMLGYADCGEDLQKGDEQQGCFATGDIARRDEEGYFYIVGRKSRFAKVLGHRIALDELESLIYAEFPETEIACIADERALTFFITREASAQAIKQFVAKSLRLSPAVIKVEVVDVLPRNAAGKLLYSTLRADHDRA